MRRALRPLAVGLIATAALLAGASLLLRRLFPSVGDAESDRIALVAAGTGIELAGRAASFQGGSARAILGGIELDLTRARLHPEGAHLDLEAVLGGVDLIVPADWPLRILSARTVAGGVEHPEPAEPEPDEGPVLTLAMRAVLGGVSVRKRPRIETLPVARGCAYT